MTQRRTNQTDNTLSDHTKDRTGNPGGNHDNLYLAGLAAYAEAGLTADRTGGPGDRALDRLVRRHGR